MEIILGLTLGTIESIQWDGENKALCTEPSAYAHYCIKNSIVAQYVKTPSFVQLILLMDA